ncbi:MAG: hypothetical protein JWR37_1846 [Mycobacterium sp.]|jgi:hypothetical protein|nr:hypothetical protein [Mycobacterium sp.]
MRMRFTHIAPMLAAGAAAVAIAAAPIAAAAPAPSAAGGSAAAAPSDPGQSSQQSCATLGSNQSVCQSPGNAQVNDGLPQPDYFPYAGGAT